MGGGDESASRSFEVSAWNSECNSLNILLVRPVTRRAQIQGVGEQTLSVGGLGYRVTWQKAWIQGEAKSCSFFFLFKSINYKAL